MTMLVLWFSISFGGLLLIDMTSITVGNHGSVFYHLVVAVNRYKPNSRTPWFSIYPWVAVALDMTSIYITPTNNSIDMTNIYS